MSEVKTSELKPCPFCGGEGRLMKNSWMIKGESQKVAYVYCKKCNARTNYILKERVDDFIGVAVKKWNRRAE